MTELDTDAASIVGEEHRAVEPPAVEPLWDGDPGTLREDSRRALAALVKGPYVSAERHSAIWRALVADSRVIRSRLADLFLELVVDTTLGVAFVRGAQTDAGTAPQVVRTLPLTFIDTVLLLHLRGELVRAGGSGRVIVGRDEVDEQLHTYRTAASTDEAGFTKRINASWSKLEKQNILLPTSTEGRYEVSPVLRLVFGPEEIAAVRAEYARLGDDDTNDDPEGQA
ncbi:DUF4194 domain-containing protein [Cellulosimicrobium cellulans]|uniref:DUF4194 domain-containing protein n=1 Tax=Cellulosimicrobium cellulans TaxID=1710 RepID=UPI0024065514|nr:DUF4194 domain-containing protein [Cellulosimicrobium cellulans]MDF9876458.1 hypothetical protein [Cellulosimicrobium cellulans]